MTPGGYHSFEHRWALAQAFRFHAQIGPARIEARIHALAARLKSGLAAIPRVRLITPRSASVSAGLVCFEVPGVPPAAIVEALRRQRIIATTTPYNPTYARLGPGIVNTAAEIDRAVATIRRSV